MLIRDAIEADLEALHDLDALCFPTGNLTREPAAPGEFEQGIRKNRIRIIEVDQRLIAYVHYDFPVQGHAYLNALAVHPEYQGQRLGRRLVQEFITQARKECGSTLSASCVTAIDNLRMISLLVSHGFVVRTMMRDYFGPERHRLYLQYKMRNEYVNPDERYFVPVGATAHVEKLLYDERFVITSVVHLPTGAAFEICQFDTEDFGSLAAGETSVGLGFSGVVLGAVAFVLGFAFASDRYPNAARVLLMEAALVTTISLIVYANASGELARLRSNSFGRYMKWGNILSEYGGVFPFLIVLPITFADVTDSQVAAIFIAVVFAVALLSYDRSRLSISTRFNSSWFTSLVSILICFSVIAGVLVVGHSVLMWVWTLLVSALLAGQATIFLLRRPEESLGSETGREFQVRL